MADAKSRCDGVGKPTIFEDEDHATDHVIGVLGELQKLIVRCAADGTLRAMLENEDGIRSGSLDQLFEILVLKQLFYHVVRLADFNR